MDINAKTTIKVIFILGLAVGIGALAYMALVSNGRQIAQTDSTSTSSNQQAHDKPAMLASSLQQDRLNASTATPGVKPQTNDYAVTLIGIVYSDESAESSATIESATQMHTYYIDQEIAGTDLIIEQILSDKVRLRNAANQEIVLHITNTREAPGEQAEPHKLADDSYVDREQQLALAKSIGNRPKQLAHIVSTTPTVSSHGINGLIVTPGDNPSLFRSAGFNEGDLLTQINGLDLNIPEQYALAMASIPTAETLAFTVIRDGRTIILYLDIPAKGLSLNG